MKSNNSIQNISDSKNNSEYFMDMFDFECIVDNHIENSHFGSCSFSRLNFSNVIFNQCSSKEDIFQYCVFHKTKFTNCRFKEQSFSHCIFDDCLFDKSYLFELSFHKNVIHSLAINNCELDSIGLFKSVINKIEGSHNDFGRPGRFVDSIVVDENAKPSLANIGITLN